ncbi:MAG: DUF2997 domain-containing protein [Oscillatoriales cyanobacterium SM2_2_1]|nr:DUF2997 domain-containing protein [Oscillatoriales cyanobacterium SM2_2_1]
METLEFIIYPDGRVEERVSGILGAGCAEVTAEIEAQLGTVVACELTSEHFGQTAFLSDRVSEYSRLSPSSESL